MKRSTKQLYRLLRLHDSGDPENQLDDGRIEEIKAKIDEIEAHEEDRERDTYE